MRLRNIVATLACSLAIPLAGLQADTPIPFKMKKGMVLRYEGVRKHRVEYQEGAEKGGTSSHVEQVRDWEVLNVDSHGVARIQLILVQLKLEMVDADGSIRRFDSTNVEGSDPELQEQLGKIIGKPVRVVEMDDSGLLKHSENLTKEKSYQHELPFGLAMPNELPRVGLKWKREFPIAMEPPLGSGQTYRASQICTIERMSGAELTIAATSQLEEEPKSLAEKQAAAQFLPSGTFVFDVERGLLTRSTQKVDFRMKDFAGPNTSFIFMSETVEQLVDPPLRQASRSEQ